MSRDYDDESVFKPRKEYIDMQDKMDDKIYSIIDLIKIIEKINYKLKKNVSYVNSYINLSFFVLLDDSKLIYKINAKIDHTLNFVWNEIYRKKRINRKNRISSNEVKINKLKFLERIRDLSYDIMHETFGKILIFSTKMFILYEKDMDEVHLVHSKIKKFMIQLKQNLKKIFDKENLLC